MRPRVEGGSQIHTPVLAQTTGRGVRTSDRESQQSIQ